VLRVTPEDALERVRSALGDLAVEPKLNFGAVDLTCTRENLVEVATKLRDNDDLSCRFFSFLSGVDRTEFTVGEGDAAATGELEVLIHLYSPEHVISVTLHVPVPVEDPNCPSLTSVFSGAIWHERETWEMFGIAFQGHPNLVHLYLPEDFEGTPLRKSFRLPSRMTKPWPGAKDPEEAAAGGGR
jgi:NADH-quinone oxidoreductase subunit C